MLACSRTADDAWQMLMCEEAQQQALETVFASLAEMEGGVQPEVLLGKARAWMTEYVGGLQCWRRVWAAMEKLSRVCTAPLRATDADILSAFGYPKCDGDRAANQYVTYLSKLFALAGRTGGADQADWNLAVGVSGCNVAELARQRVAASYYEASRKASSASPGLKKRKQSGERHHCPPAHVECTLATQAAVLVSDIVSDLARGVPSQLTLTRAKLHCALMLTSLGKRPIEVGFYFNSDLRLMLGDADGVPFHRAVLRDPASTLSALRAGVPVKIPLPHAKGRGGAKDVALFRTLMPDDLSCLDVLVAVALLLHVKARVLGVEAAWEDDAPLLGLGSATQVCSKVSEWRDSHVVTRLARAGFPEAATLLAQYTGYAGRYGVMAEFDALGVSLLLAAYLAGHVSAETQDKFYKSNKLLPTLPAGIAPALVDPRAAVHAEVQAVVDGRSDAPCSPLQLACVLGVTPLDAIGLAQLGVPFLQLAGWRAWRPPSSVPDILGNWQFSMAGLSSDDRLPEGFARAPQKHFLDTLAAVQQAPTPSTDLQQRGPYMPPCLAYLLGANPRPFAVQELVLFAMSSNHGVHALVAGSGGDGGGSAFSRLLVGAECADTRIRVLRPDDPWDRCSAVLMRRNTIVTSAARASTTEADIVARIIAGAAERQVGPEPARGAPMLGATSSVPAARTVGATPPAVQRPVPSSVSHQIVGSEDEDESCEEDVEDAPCKVCGDPLCAPGNDMIECDACLEFFHQKCLVPALPKSLMPTKRRALPWLCPGCDVRVVTFEVAAKEGARPLLLRAKEVRAADLPQQGGGGPAPSSLRTRVVAIRPEQLSLQDADSARASQRGEFMRLRATGSFQLQAGQFQLVAGSDQQLRTFADPASHVTPPSKEQEQAREKTGKDTGGKQRGAAGTSRVRGGRSRGDGGAGRGNGKKKMRAQ